MRSRGARRRRGTTATEMVVASMLMVLLASILGSVWRGLCLPALDASARCRIAQEANLAAAALARDLGGSLADPPGRLGGTSDGRFLARSVTAEGALQLSFDGGSGTTVVIAYQLQGQRLVRLNESTGAAATVADGVTAFQVEPLADNSGVTIALTFAARDLSLTYTLVAVDPPGT